MAKPLVNNFLPQLNQAPPPTFQKHGELKRHTNILGFIAAVVIGGGGEDDCRLDNQKIIKRLRLPLEDTVHTIITVHNII